MLGGPPQNALLCGALREEGEDELERPVRHIGAMREIAVIACGDREHAQPVEADAESESRPGDAGPDSGEASEMHEHEGNGGGIGDTDIPRGAGGYERGRE